MLTLYTPSYENDLVVSQWWAEMAAAGELATVFSSPPPLGQFLAGFKSPTVLTLALDDRGPWFAAWFEPAFSGAFFSVWVAPRKRRSTAALKLWREAAALGLTEFSHLIGVTKQVDLLPLHAALGYKEMGRLAGFFGGKDAWILVLDGESFRAKHTRRVARGVEPSSAEPPRGGVCANALH